jgi:hypothetical protein
MGIEVKRSGVGDALTFSWWARHRPRWRYCIAGSVDAADLLPDLLPKKALVVVENDERATWVAFDCPCKRRHRLLIPLSTSKQPHWKLRRDKRPSLTPSVDSHDGVQRCHFWLTNGPMGWWISHVKETAT